MALVLADRVKETTNTTGTGTLTLAGAVSGFQSFAAVGNGNSTYYTITSGTDWEVGIGTYTASGTTLSRDTVLASSAGGTIKITVAAGANVFVTYPAGKAIAAGTGYFTDVYAGSFVDGVVIDYASGAGRISVGGADDINFYNGGVAGSLLGQAKSNGDWTFNGFIDVGTGTLVSGATNPLIAAAGSANSYVQAYVHNDLNNTSSSADLTAYPHNGLDTSGWVDMGITSLSYSDAAYSVTGGNEGYIFMSAPSGSSTSGNLVFATDSTGTTNYFQWYVGGFNQAKGSWEMQLRGTQLDLSIPLNSTVATGTAPFTVASTTQVANLNAATAGTATTATNATNVSNTGAVATNASFFPTFVAANTTSNQGVNTAAGLSFNPSTNVLSPTAVLLASSSGAQAPIKLTAGTNLATAQAGAIEYDGTSFYSSMATSTRGVVPSEQIVVLNTAYTLTSQTAAQKLFNASTNGAVTLPVGTYQFECFYSLTGMSATSGSFGFAMVAGTAVIGSQGWRSIAEKGTATVATATAGQLTYSTAANTTLATASTNTVGYAFISGIIKITTAGTVIPSVSLGVAAAAVVGINSYFKIAPVTGAATANITVGNWS